MHLQQNAISAAYIHLGHCFHRKAQHLQFVPLLQFNITTPHNDTFTHTQTHTQKVEMVNPWTDVTVSGTVIQNTSPTSSTFITQTQNWNLTLPLSYDYIQINS